MKLNVRILSVCNCFSKEGLMDAINTIAAVAQSGARIVSEGLGRFIPEPANRLGLNFKAVVGTMASSLSGAAVFPGVESGYAEMLNQQMQVQQQMQLVSMYSNIEKSKHETQMSAVRNIRVG